MIVIQYVTVADTKKDLEETSRVNIFILFEHKCTSCVLVGSDYVWRKNDNNNNIIYVFPTHCQFDIHFIIK